MKTLFKITCLSILSTFLINACDNHSSERQKAAGEKLKGSTQETVGKLTDDSELKNAGKANRTKGDLRSTKEDIKDVITGD